MAKPIEDKKVQALRDWGAWHASAADVTDEWFRSHEFFDARDLVQVKYEMLRRVQHDGMSLSEASRRFGFSRQAFYQAQAVFQEQGLPGLIPKRPGPKTAHKLSGDVLAFLDEQLADNDSLRSTELATLIAEQFDLSVHPRSIERAFERRRKKGR